MKKQIFLFSVFVISIFCNCYLSFAQEIHWNGYLQTENRLQLNGKNDFTWQEYRLDLQAEVKPAEKSRFYGELWIRSWGVPTVQNSSDLTIKDKVSPYGLDFREAYVDFYGFLFSNIDIRIGRQRIAWGTADKINPTDNLNPYDLENFWDFGSRLGSNGIKISYYLKGFTFTGAYIPVFTPAVLPKGNYASALFPSMELPGELTLKNIKDTILMPKSNPQESSTYGIKLSKNILNYDFSLSYVYGRDYLPLAKKVTFTPASLGVVDISNELIYPKMQIAGIDMAGAISNVGIWAEAAIFYPDKVEMTTDLSALGMGITSSVALDDKPYIKYVLGADYTFKNNIYIHGQYIRGLFHEKGQDNLGNYVMTALKWKSSDEKIKIIPIGIAAEIKDFKDIENNYALILSPEITYRPVDNGEVTLGVRWIDGKGTTTFGQLKDNDEMYFKVKYSF